MNLKIGVTRILQDLFCCLYFGIRKEDFMYAQNERKTFLKVTALACELFKIDQKKPGREQEFWTIKLLNATVCESGTIVKRTGWKPWTFKTYTHG